MKTKCAQCGKKSKKNHKFCVECGTLLPEEIIAPELVKCSGCGDSISASIKFCNKCGVQLSGEEEHIKKGKRNKPLRRKITGIALLSLLILIVLTIGVYIGAGFLFKHEIVEIEDASEIIDEIQKYRTMDIEDNEITLEIETEAVNALLLEMDINNLIDNRNIRIDGVYLQSKSMRVYANIKAYGLYFPLSFSMDIVDDDDEMKMKIVSLKHSSLNLPMPTWFANLILRKHLTLSREDGVLPQNIFFRSISGSRRDVEVVVEVDAEQIIKNAKKELDDADTDILKAMSQSQKFIQAYSVLSEDLNRVQTTKLMRFISRGYIHLIYVPLNKDVVEEEMGTLFYNSFAMEDAIDNLDQYLTVMEE